MKENKIYLTGLLLALLPLSVHAATSTCSSSGTVTRNNTITITVSVHSDSEAAWDTYLKYDSSKLQYVSGSGLHAIDENFKKDLTYTYTFKAIGTGSTSAGTTTNLSDYDGNKGYTSSNCAINIVNYTTPSNSGSTSKSSSGSSSSSSSNSNTNSKTNSNSETGTTTEEKDSTNSLESITLDNGILDPKFDKDTLEYAVDVENDVEKINIEAKATSDKATITGTGEKDLEEGQNKVEITVTSETGSTRTYVLNINRKEKTPVKVKIDGKEYTVIRKVGILEPPSNFEETKVEINGESVLAYKHKKLDIIIVGLTNENNKSAWYIYDTKDKTFTKYIEYNNDDFRLLLKSAKKKMDGFIIKDMSINNQDVKVYVSNRNNNFIVVNAINLRTGKEGYYIYDKLNSTFIAYEPSIYMPKMNKLSANGLYDEIMGSGYKGIYAAAGAIFVLIILLDIVLSAKNRRLKKKLKFATIGNENNMLLDDDDDNIMEDEPINKEVSTEPIEEKKDLEEVHEGEPATVETYESTKENQEETNPDDELDKSKKIEELKPIEDTNEETITKENGISELEEISKLYNESLERQNAVDEDGIDDDFADLKPKRRRHKKKKGQN